MVSGKSPMEIHSLDNSGGIEHHRMVTWVMEKVKNAPTTMFWIEEIVDCNLEGKYDVNQVENLVKVALKCVKDDMNERPSMSQVVEIKVLNNGNGNGRVKIFVISAVTGVALQIAVVTV
jgi:hypothetical protein